MPLSDGYLWYLRILCNMATPGKWVVRLEYDGGKTICMMRSLNATIGVHSEAESKPWEASLANAEFIAAARTAVPELIAEIERLRKELKP